ncbi:hypothetical protein ABPG75_001164 [Micractinium tetrahymenae]
MSFLDAREHGSKPGSGFVSQQQEAIDRRERLRRLALETIDLSKDPYFMRNHLGQYECRLCLTLHTNEGNYLAHTQGKRHQQNLAKRAAREAAEKPVAPAPQRRVAIKKTVRIGRPGYRVTKQYDAETGSRGLLFQIEYPEIEEGTKPRHRVMSSYEQRKEPWSKEWQYLLFAAEPYEVIAFKIPSYEVEKHPEKLFTHWDPDNKVYSLQLPFKAPAPGAPSSRPAGAPAAAGPQQQLPPPPQFGMPPPPQQRFGGPPPPQHFGGPPPPQFGRPPPPYPMRM